MEKERLVEIINIECAEFCLLNIDTGEKEFYKWPSKFSENEGKFTGLYYYESDSDLFFALIPTTEGPLAFYNQNIYPITDKLTIECEDLGKSGVFKIYEYGINIKYKYSKYLGFEMPGLKKKM